MTTVHRLARIVKGRDWEQTRSMRPAESADRCKGSAIAIVTAKRGDTWLPNHAAVWYSRHRWRRNRPQHAFPGSSSGRTADSGSVNRGSNPRPGAPNRLLAHLSSDV